MTWESYRVVATLDGPYSDLEHSEVEEYLAGELGCTVEEKDESLVITYEAGGNVDAGSHTASLLRELEEVQLEARRLTIMAGPVKD